VFYLKFHKVHNLERTKEGGRRGKKRKKKKRGKQKRKEDSKEHTCWVTISFVTKYQFSATKGLKFDFFAKLSKNLRFITGCQTLSTLNVSIFD
jgi:hypothetical protein